VARCFYSVSIPLFLVSFSFTCCVIHLFYNTRHIWTSTIHCCYDEFATEMAMAMDQRRRWQRWQHPELPKVFQLPIVYSCVLQPWLGAATKLPRRNCHCYDPMKRTSKVAANAFCDNRGDNDNGEEHVAERAACLGSFVSVATNFISCKPVTPLMSATPASFTNRLLRRHQVDCVVASRGSRRGRACVCAPDAWPGP